MTQADKAEVFRRLHDGPEPLLLPNPWDAGSAKILTALGFKALTTTSAGLAWSLGGVDGSVTRDQALANARAIVEATHLPVAADLEDGYGPDPATVAQTIKLAAEAGLVGASIEDATGEPATPIYDFDFSVKRIEAAAKAAHALPFPFMLVARCENFLQGIDDLEDTIARLRAYEEAGADVLYAPLLPDPASIRRVVESVSKPVNVLAAGPVLSMSVDDLRKLGVRRISVGSGAARVAYGAFIDSAKEMRDSGRFERIAHSVTFAEIQDLLVQGG